MKALLLDRYSHFSYTDVPDPGICEDEVLVRVEACAICGSDVHGMDGSSGRRRPPIIMGHEAAGTIEAVGALVGAWKRGARVTFDSTIWCGVCSYCRSGRINLCDSRRVLGVSCEEYRRHGAMAQYVSVPARILCAVPDETPFVRACMAEPLSIAVHAVERTPLRLGDSCLVVGAGNIGLLIIQVLRARGAGTVLAVDPDSRRRAAALELGADRALDASETSGEQIRAISSGGVLRAFDAAGLERTLQSALEGVRKGGSVTLVGNLAPQVSFAQQQAVTREIDLIASCASSGEYPVCIELIRSGAVNVDALVSHAVPLSEGAAWFERLHRREPGLGKVVLLPWGEVSPEGLTEGSHRRV